MMNPSLLRSRPIPFALMLLLIATPADAQPEKSADREAALATMKKAATYYRTKVAAHGGYVYHYSEDLTQRWGEGKAGPDTIFVQPPGTPTVGMAYLKAYLATKDSYYLEAAQAAAEALVRGQLESGGWTQVIHFAPVAGRMGKYRKGSGGTWNASSLDDGQTQSALEFLFTLDHALNFKNERIHEAAKYGLDALLKAQFANGAFPQVWTAPASPQPVLKAGFPEYDWKTEGRVKNYWDFYTLNDGLAGSVCNTLITAHNVYQEDRIHSALTRLGDFLLLAQMPSPQPAWCQQYGYDMKPIWARKFEPPAIAGSESQDVMSALIRITQHTGQTKYLDPIPAATAYLRQSLLPDGKMARFYELKTNKPLYMNAKYELSYDSSNAPTHYGWKHSSRLDRIEKDLTEAKRGKPPTKKSRPSEAEVRRAIETLDDQGRWLETHSRQNPSGQSHFEEGFKFLSSATFSKNMEILARFVEP